MTGKWWRFSSSLLLFSYQLKIMVVSTSPSGCVTKQTWPPQQLGRNAGANGCTSVGSTSMTQATHEKYMTYGCFQNRDTPKSSIYLGFSIINHPFWGTTIFGNTHIIIIHISIGWNDWLTWSYHFFAIATLHFIDLSRVHDYRVHLGKHHMRTNWSSALSHWKIEPPKYSLCHQLKSHPPQTVDFIVWSERAPRSVKH